MKTTAIVLSLFFSLIVAGSTYYYATSTKGMFNQMIDSNILIRKEQTMLMRPYISLDVPLIKFKKPAQPDEIIKFYFIVKNTGQLPAIDVKKHTWIDENNKPDAGSIPESAQHFSIGPTSDMESIYHPIAREELKKIINEYDKAYLHAIISYCDQDTIQYTSKYSYKIDYIEGEDCDVNIEFGEIL